MCPCLYLKLNSFLDVVKVFKYHFYLAQLVRTLKLHASLMKVTYRNKFEKLSVSYVFTKELLKTIMEI